MQGGEQEPGIRVFLKGVGAREPRLAAIVLNWRDAEATLDCLDSLAPEMALGSLCVVLCDNASGDGLETMLECWAAKFLAAGEFAPPAAGDGSAQDGVEAMPALVLLRTGCNGGYAFGNNCGLRWVLRFPRVEYAWILNNDTVVEPGSVGALLQHADANERAGAVGSTVLDMAEGGVQCAGGFRYYPAIAAMRALGKGGSIDDLARKADRGRWRLDYIYGAAMLLRMEAVRRIGLLDEAYFLYFEELDYAHRLRSAGYTLTWCRQSRVRHRGTGSPTRPRAARQQYHEQLSALRYTLRHHPGFLPLVLVLRLVGKPLAMCIKGQVRLVPAGLRAVQDFFWPRVGARTEF